MPIKVQLQERQFMDKVRDQTSEKTEMLLHKAKTIIEDYQRSQVRQGGSFNIFSILGVGADEVKHCAFFYDLLNPKGSHSLDSLFLQLFLEAVLQIKNFEMQDIVVEREKDIGRARLDLYISNRKEFIIIEAKIYERVSWEQLSRYQEWAKKQQGKKFHLYCLTLQGDEAEDKENEKTQFQFLSFASDILAWIEKCMQLEQVQAIPQIREILKQYSVVLKKITDQNPEGLEMNLTQLLLQNDNLAIADKLSKAIAATKAALEMKFWQAVIEKINPTMQTLGFTYDSANYAFNHSFEEAIQKERAKKKGNIWFVYMLGYYRNDKNSELVISIGNSGYDERIYWSFGLFDMQKRENIAWNRNPDFTVLSSHLEQMGWIKEDEWCRYQYLSYDFNLHSEKICRLADNAQFTQICDAVSSELLALARQVAAERNNLLQ
jgi:hypothetical protein